MEEDIEKKISKQDMINMLEESYKYIDEMPPHARLGFVTHQDLSSVLSLLVALFRSD